MNYISTQDRAKHKYTLKEAAFMGLAPDGGLFVPEQVPQVDMKVVSEKAGQSFADLAFYLAGFFFGEELEEKELYRAVRDVFCFPVELKHLGEKKYTLELFHGPTFAFKDFGAGFMGRMLGILNKSEEELTILTATSGDTGSAVAHGFYDIPGIQVVILYPEGKVSPLQESQMTTLGKNIRPVRVNGSFDDCQKLVKMIFNDADFRKKKRVTSANSINLLRWLPQSFYYFYGYYLWKKETGRDFPEIAVPSGNYGNLSAGMLAKQMGLPIGRFIAASNVNDIIPRYLKTGHFDPRPSIHTIANAMDVGNPSNYERILHLYKGDFQVITEDVKGYSCTDEEIETAIAEIYRKYRYISDPHSAVGYNAGKFYDLDGFWLSTAHEAKFGEVIRKVLSIEPELPESLKSLLQKEKCFTSIEANIEDLKNVLMQ